MNVREIVAARELLLFLTWRDVKIRYKQTVLGVAWAVLQPLLMMMVFTVLFQRLGKIPTGDVPGPVFYYAALLPWTFFASGLMNAGNSLITNTDLLTKVYFPRPIIPAATVLAGLVDLAIASALLLFLLPYYGLLPDLELLAWPIAIGLLMALTLGGGMLVAAINVVYRDVKYALPFAIQLMMFVSPVIWSTETIPERFQLLWKLNPLSGIIEASRAALVPGKAVDWGHLGIAALVTACIVAAGITYFGRVERRFADIV